MSCFHISFPYRLPSLFLSPKLLTPPRLPAGGHDSFPMLRFTTGQVSPVCFTFGSTFNAAKARGSNRKLLKTLTGQKRQYHYDNVVNCTFLPAKGQSNSPFFLTFWVTHCKKQRLFCRPQTKNANTPTHTQPPPPSTTPPPTWETAPCAVIQRSMFK